VQQLGAAVATLGEKGARGDLEGMLGHSADFLEAMSVVVIGWVWTKVTNACAGRDDAFADGLRAAATYWLVTDVPRVSALLDLCTSCERSFLDVRVDSF